MALNINENNKDWQEITVETNEFGSFNKAKIKLINPEGTLLYNKRKKVVLTHEVLPTSQGYWSLDGREFTVRLKNQTICLIRTEDCGLGNAKARHLVTTLGFKIA